MEDSEKRETEMEYVDELRDWEKEYENDPHRLGRRHSNVVCWISHFLCPRHDSTKSKLSNHS